MDAPTAVNGLPVVASRRKLAGASELAEQFYVICRDERREPATTYILWTAGYDPNYQGGTWVAVNGRYDLSLSRAELLMDERARGA